MSLPNSTPTTDTWRLQTDGTWDVSHAFDDQMEEIGALA
jgi:hypothetical protein